MRSFMEFPPFVMRARLRTKLAGGKKLHPNRTGLDDHGYRGTSRPKELGIAGV
jgi:hypothetical protein